MAIVLSVIPRFCIVYHSSILYCMSFLDLRLLITPLVSCGHCIVCPSSIYDFWLLLWYLVAIVLSVLPRFTTFDYPFGILWPLYCLSFLDLRLLIIPFGILWPLYCLSLLDLRLLIIRLYLVAIVLSFPPRFTTSDYPFCILWPLYCLSPPRFTTSDYPFVILWPLYCLSFLD